MLEKMREALEIAKKGQKMVDAYVSTRANAIRNLTDNPAAITHPADHVRLAA
jgi:hypothetical protein